MEPPPPQGSLTEEERQLLRKFMAANRGAGWPGWLDGVFFSLLVAAGLVASQLLMRWLPGRLEARGLAVCLRTPTAHHGDLWVPDSFGFAELLRGPGALCTIYVVFFGVALLALLRQQRQARRACRLFARCFPQAAIQP